MKHVVLERTGEWGTWDPETGAMVYDASEFEQAFRDPPGLREIEHDGPISECPICI